MTNYNWASYQSATGCTKYGPAGAQNLTVYLEDCFPGQSSFGICNCRSVVGGSSWSHHAECRAYDEGFAVFKGQTIGIQTLELLGPHGNRLGIDHMIVNLDPGGSGRGKPMVYSVRSPQGRVYTGTHPHKNHNHIGLTRNAGRHLTYATLVAVAGHPSQVGGEDMAAVQVIDLQKALNAAGANPKLVEDDSYGPKTAGAWVKALSSGTGSVVDAYTKVEANNRFLQRGASYKIGD